MTSQIKQSFLELFRFSAQSRKESNCGAGGTLGSGRWAFAAGLKQQSFSLRDTVELQAVATDSVEADVFVDYGSDPATVG